MLEPRQNIKRTGRVVGKLSQLGEPGNRPLQTKRLTTL
jgi:hypothetical protein